MEKNNHTTAQKWWRTLADDLTLEQAQASLEVFARTQDSRDRRTEAERTTAATVYTAERLSPLPAVTFPVVIDERKATRP